MGANNENISLIKRIKNFFKRQAKKDEAMSYLRPIRYSQIKFT